MAVRKKAANTVPKAQKKESDDDEANQGDEGMSLDEYFNSKKDYTIESMKETSELLEKENVKAHKFGNAMVMAKNVDSCGDDDNETVIPVCPMETDDDAEERKYEDDYESDDEKEQASAVAGLTLSDYLTGSLKPKPEKEPKQKLKSKKDQIASIEGMSLESYLGVSATQVEDSKNTHSK
jgi:hypothetical protein